MVITVDCQNKQLELENDSNIINLISGFSSVFLWCLYGVLNNDITATLCNMSSPITEYSTEKQILCFCTMHFNINMQYKAIKCTFSKLIFYFLIF